MVNLPVKQDAMILMWLQCNEVYDRSDAYTWDIQITPCGCDISILGPETNLYMYVATTLEKLIYLSILSGFWN